MPGSGGGSGKEVIHELCPISLLYAICPAASQVSASADAHEATKTPWTPKTPKALNTQCGNILQAVFGGQPPESMLVTLCRVQSQCRGVILVPTTLYSESSMCCAPALCSDPCAVPRSARSPRSPGKGLATMEDARRVFGTGWVHICSDGQRMGDWCDPWRPLRVASDCSGAGIPELALETMTKHGLARFRNVHSVFASDIQEHCRTWLTNNVKPEHLFTDISLRWFEKDTFLARDIYGHAVRITRETADLDVYVAGFVCSPFSGRGKREGWRSPSCSTFVDSIRTISCLRPRIAVLENVPGVLKEGCLDHLTRALDLVPGYTWRILKLNTCRFGLPQNRTRVYVVMLRTDALKALPCTCHKVILEFVCKAQFQFKGPPHFPDFFARADVGEPIVREVSDVPDVEDSEDDCTCDVNQLCKLHCCTCRRCKDLGKRKLCCLWRLDAKRYQLNPRERANASKYLANWRKVHKDPKVRSVPTYLVQARKLKIHVMAGTARERGVLQVLSRGRNICQRNAVLDLAQNAGRAAFRCDGLVPTLTSTCGSIFLPRFGVYLTPWQCMALQGLSKAGCNATDVSDAQIYKMAGNAMSTPVIGVILWAALCQLNHVQ